MRLLLPQQHALRGGVQGLGVVRKGFEGLRALVAHFEVGGDDLLCLCVGAENPTRRRCCQLPLHPKPQPLRRPHARLPDDAVEVQFVEEALARPVGRLGLPSGRLQRIPALAYTARGEPRFGRSCLLVPAGGAQQCYLGVLHP